MCCQVPRSLAHTSIAMTRQLICWRIVGGFSFQKRDDRFRKGYLVDRLTMADDTYFDRASYVAKKCGMANRSTGSNQGRRDCQKCVACSNRIYHFVRKCGNPAYRFAARISDTAK